jgi:hypothetical protein
MVFLLLKSWAVVNDFIIVILYFLVVELIPAYLILYEDIRHYRRKREVFSHGAKSCSHNNPASVGSNSSALPSLADGSRESLSDSLDSFE